MLGPILLMANPTKDKAASLLPNIINFLTKHNITYEQHDGSPITKSYPLAITLGGDGTVIRGGRLLYGLNTPILAINVGTLGFLSYFKAGEWQQALAMLLNDDLIYTNRTLLNIKIKRHNEIVYSDIAINEAVVTCYEHLRMVNINLTINNENLGTIKADGLIAATATGSTAYSLSCGGPIMPPEARSLILVPISPFSLAMRPLVVPQSDEIVFNIKDYQRAKLVLILDGHAEFPLKEHDKVIITADEQTLKLYGPNNLQFYQLLRQKLGWKGLPEGIAN
ncbi:MAG: NAD(+)/NADH kinase [Spirochaetaceae bacterium]|nr:NAD(+)/NADH kinase [Spirochaetaceae bacterium]